MKSDREPSPGIKQTPPWLVKPLAILAAVALLGVVLSTPARSDDENPLPDIEAKTFNVTIQRRSRSGRVYLFETPEAQPLHLGKILLLRQNDQPVMAFRVLRDYGDKNQFAAKWVRRYRGISQLEPSQEYLAIEKLADRPGPPLTAQDQAELREIETGIPAPPAGEGAPNEQAPAAPGGEEQIPTPSGSVPNAQPYDSELDSGSSEPTKNTIETQNAELTPADEREIDELSSITAQELIPIDRYWNWFTMGFAFFHNNGASPDANSGYLGGADFKYGRTIRQMIYLKKKDIQDSLVAEGTLGYYKVVSFASPNDVYSVIPFTATVRYNVLFGEDITVFGYLGLNKNFVMNSSAANPGDQSAVSTATDQLNSFFPAIGVGALFRVGPSWYIRVDTGYDQLGMALTLRF